MNFVFDFLHEITTYEPSTDELQEIVKNRDKILSSEQVKEGIIVNFI